MPAYNAAAYITETINCILNQDEQNFEIIIVDDGSEDDTLNILHQIIDKKIKVFSVANGGAAKARNIAYQNAKGDYIIFFDADDWIPKNFIRTQLGHLKSSEEVVVAKWGRFYQNILSSIKVAPNQLKDDLTFEEWIIAYWGNVSHMTCPGRVLIPRNLVEKSGLWDEDLSLNDDFCFFTRIFSNTDVIRYNDDSLFYYRSGIGGLSSTKGSLALGSLYQSITRAITIAQSKIKKNIVTDSCYANILQQFTYEAYPLELQLIKKAKKSIKAFGGSDLKFPAGGTTKLLNYLFGWKLVKRIKLLSKKSLI